MRATTKSALSLGRKGLLELMQIIGFGRIEGLPLVNSEPILIPHPRVIREVKFGGDNGPRPQINVADFLLKAQVIELFDQFDRMSNGTIAVLEVKYGLPFRMLVAEIGK